MNFNFEPNFVDNLYEFKKKAYEEHQLRSLFFEVTSRCNARCEHCGSSCGDFIPKDEITKEEMIGVLDDIAEHYDPTRIMLDITGGEPLVKKDLFEIMDYANKLGFRWGMTSNGMLINDEILKKSTFYNDKILGSDYKNMIDDFGIIEDEEKEN